MRFSYILLLLLVIHSGTYAQNIVPNYSFEQADSCPTAPNSSTYKYSLGCEGWGEATNSTTDYFNSCDTASRSIGTAVPRVGVPYNLVGYQQAFEGSAYMGMVAYNSVLPDYREYLITNIPALQKDTMYYVSIEVSLADSSKYAVNGLGVFFSTYGSPGQFSGDILSVIPQIDYSIEGIVSDTTHWIKLSGSFRADSAYTNLIIGGFKKDSDLLISDFNSTPMVNLPYISYYYIDNIVVEKLSSTKISLLNRDPTPFFIPNPMTENAQLIFRNIQSEQYRFALYNCLGDCVQGPVYTTSDRINIERKNLPTGVYYYRLQGESGYVTNGKIEVK